MSLRAANTATTTSKTQVTKGGEVAPPLHTTTTPLFKGWCGGGWAVGTTAAITQPIWANLRGA